MERKKIRIVSTMLDSMEIEEEGRAEMKDKEKPRNKNLSSWERLAAKILPPSPPRKKEGEAR